MKKRILDVGQCDMDHGNISRMLAEHFDVAIDRAHLANDAVRLIQENTYDLILVNRVLDRDHSEGIDILHELKADDSRTAPPVMLVSNYAESQQQAVNAGAIMGFGKSELATPETIAKLKTVLG